jgi:hypothetical protein
VPQSISKKIRSSHAATSLFEDHSASLTSHGHLRFAPAGVNFSEPEMANKQTLVAPRNRLLNAFESASRERIDPHLERIEIKLGDVICEAGGILNHAYFPVGAVISLLTVLENGTAIETANIGREGAFGLFAAMYSRTHAVQENSNGRK